MYYYCLNVVAKQAPGHKKPKPCTRNPVPELLYPKCCTRIINHEPETLLQVRWDVLLMPQRGGQSNSESEPRKQTVYPIPDILRPQPNL